MEGVVRFSKGDDTSGRRLACWPPLCLDTASSFWDGAGVPLGCSSGGRPATRVLDNFGQIIASPRQSDLVWGLLVSSGFFRSVPAVATRRGDRLELLEIELGNCLELVG